MNPSAAVRESLAPPRTLSLDSRPPRLFTDRGCPFAHRVRALLEHLGRPAEVVESLVGDEPEGIGQYSASRGIPLLVHGDLVIHESRVMLEHLAEHHGFADAYPADLAARTLHRHAMAVVDAHLVPWLGGTYTEPDGPLLYDTLRAVEDATRTVAPKPGLLAFHLGPIWLRFQLWQPDDAVTRAVESRTALRTWLDAANRLDSLERTAPDPATHLVDLARARAAGLLPPAKTPTAHDD